MRSNAAVSIRELLPRLLGKNVSPYPYQGRVDEFLRQGRNVLISAPTGAGKTWSVLLPFLLSSLEGRRLADRVIYALPMRTLAVNLWDSTRKACERAGLAGTLEDDATSKEILRITIQTGERKEDKFFQGDIIFTTIDQLLSSYLMMPVSLPGRLANINAGALVGSLIVFDEVHLLEPGRSLATVLDLARRFRGLAQFVLMTATLSGRAAQILEAELNAELVAVDEKDLDRMPNQREKQRTWVWVPRALTPEDVIEQHAGGRSIVVCNTVWRAQQVYAGIRELLAKKGLPTMPFLLHSRFLRDDRRSVEDELSSYFGPAASKTDVILVATQAIEVGIDISADILHAEICPANSLLQRAGRCARYEGKRGVGTVRVYELPTSDNGTPQPGPYRELVPLIDATREVIARETWNGTVVGYWDEQALVRRVHEDQEGTLLGNVILNARARAGEVAQAVDTGDRSKIRDLIRDVDSVGVLVHDRPEEVRPADGPEVVSVPRTSLWALSRAFDDGSVQWVAMQPKDTQEMGDLEFSGRHGFTWERVSSMNELRLAPWMIALNPAVASYDKELGLILGRPGGTTPIRYLEREAFGDSRMRCESSEEHARKTVAATSGVLGRSTMAVRMLEKRLSLPVGTVERMALAGAALHDTGKLQVSWQRGITTWQRHKNPNHPILLSGEPLAHSDYVYHEDWQEARSSVYSRPPHAVQGALAISNVLFDDFVAWLADEQLAMDCTAIVCSVIARHHSARAETVESFSLIPSAGGEVEKYLRLIGHEARSPSLVQQPGALVRQDFVDSLIKMERDDTLFPLYGFLVRCLRLADQAATSS